jgi:hypothetical protein
MTNDRHEASQLLAGIESMIMDRATSSAYVVMGDGFAAAMPLDPSPFNSTSTIVRIQYVPSVNLLFMDTSRGDTIETELPTLKDPAPRGGRPVVYLDQRDWSLLANALFDPERIRNDSERDAATQLIALARAQKIILPMSFAHIGETSKWSDMDRRYRHALTLAQLSRGWQMRYPIDVWQYELQQTFVSRFKQAALPPVDVFTLEGCAMESKPSFQDTSLWGNGFPPDLEYIRRATVCMMSYIDTILAAETLTMSPIPEWVDTFQLITNALAKERATPAQKRSMLRFPLLRDLEFQIAEAVHQAGVTTPDVRTWVGSHFTSDVRSMGCLGLWNEFFQDKHLNTGTKWRSNDLIDMLYLTCAAGHADYVLAERSSTSYLNQATKRLGRPIKVYSQIDDLVAALAHGGL